MYKSAYSQEFFIQLFFWEFRPFLNLEIWPKFNILMKQFVKDTTLKPLSRISCNFVVDKDIQCTCAHSQKILIGFFF